MTLIVSAQARAQSQQPKPAPNGRTPPNQDPNNASPNTRLTRMVQQVKDVLPQVPATVISRDLSEYKTLALETVNIRNICGVLLCCTEKAHQTWENGPKRNIDN